jgi:hypothetical protein
MIGNVIVGDHDRDLVTTARDRPDGGCCGGYLYLCLCLYHHHDGGLGDDPMEAEEGTVAVLLDVEALTLYHCTIFLVLDRSRLRPDPDHGLDRVLHHHYLDRESVHHGCR